MSALHEGYVTLEAAATFLPPPGLFDFSLRAAGGPAVGHAGSTAWLLGQWRRRALNRGEGPYSPVLSVTRGV